MRKSRMVAAGLAGTVAALLAGCSNQSQVADCVDAQGNVLPDSYCQSYSGGGYYGGGGGNVVIVHSGGPHWVYGGNVTTSGGVSRVSGGSVTPSGGGDISSLLRDGARRLWRQRRRAWLRRRTRRGWGISHAASALPAAKRMAVGSGSVGADVAHAFQWLTLLERVGLLHFFRLGSRRFRAGHQRSAFALLASRGPCHRQQSVRRTRNFLRRQFR